MVNQLDPINIATDGILSLDPLLIVGLGIIIEEIIPVIPPVDNLPVLHVGGGGFFSGVGSSFSGKKKKKVKLTVNVPNISKPYIAEFYLDNINLTVKNVKLQEDKIILNILDITMESYIHEIKVNVSNIFI